MRKLSLLALSKSSMRGLKLTAAISVIGIGLAAGGLSWLARDTPASAVESILSRASLDAKLDSYPEAFWDWAAEQDEVVRRPLSAAAFAWPKSSEGVPLREATAAKEGQWPLPDKVVAALQAGPSDSTTVLITQLCSLEHTLDETLVVMKTGEGFSFQDGLEVIFQEEAAKPEALAWSYEANTGEGASMVEPTSRGEIPRATTLRGAERWPELRAGLALSSVDCTARGDASTPVEETLQWLKAPELEPWLLSEGKDQGAVVEGVALPSLGLKEGVASTVQGEDDATELRLEFLIYDVQEAKKRFELWQRLPYPRHALKAASQITGGSQFAAGEILALAGWTMRVGFSDREVNGISTTTALLKWSKYKPQVPLVNAQPERAEGPLGLSP